MKKGLLILSTIFIFFITKSQTKTILVDYNVVSGSGKNMTGVNTGPNSVVAGTTKNCLNQIGNRIIRTHDYHGPCDYWSYTNFFNYFTQTFNYAFQSHLPSGYNWTMTDAQIDEIVNSGFEPYFRVGISFPGGGVSPASPMPKDVDGVNFHTFAGIAKRTAMHYTGGWDSGYNYQIPYWEIWNEPNNQASWTVDSAMAYYRMYKQCADSLKSFNPQLKVGGPAAAKNSFYNGGIHFTINPKYVTDFLSYCQTNTAPLDFYSFHMYDRPNPYNLRILTDTLSNYLNQYGFSNTELIVSETNINTPGYDNTAKGCSYLASELISVANTRLSKLIWYRGVDLNPLCYSDSGTNSHLTLNGYAYQFFNALNDTTPVYIQSPGSEFNATNVNDSLNNLMILSGKNSAGTIVKVLVSNHESIYNNLQLSLQNLPWSNTDNISIRTESVTSAGYQTSTSSQAGNSTMTLNLSNVADASVYLITFRKNVPNAMEQLISSDKHDVYPNPADQKVYLRTGDKHFTLTLINVYGQILFVQKDNPEMDISHVPDGVYALMILNENGTVEKHKIVVSK
ncbi:MAG: T9SS type A sorting domain-containing protein [Chitinophagaceae bacterium]|nr:T9SS type A sorting domain-containing protein [Chitinophagaceae bacterium]